MYTGNAQITLFCMYNVKAEEKVVATNCLSEVKRKLCSHKQTNISDTRRTSVHGPTL